MLAKKLIDHQEMSRRMITRDSNRNAASDLVSLGLAQWAKDALTPTKALSGEGPLDYNDCLNLICDKARKSEFVARTMEILSKEPI